MQGNVEGARSTSCGTPVSHISSLSTAATFARVNDDDISDLDNDVSGMSTSLLSSPTGASAYEFDISSEGQPAGLHNTLSIQDGTSRSHQIPATSNTSTNTPVRNATQLIDQSSVVRRSIYLVFIIVCAFSMLFSCGIAF
jgi:hypothetical protein